jgi:hypothetical protein
MVSKTSFSHDNISNKQLKCIAKEISFPLSHLINMSFKHDYVPTSWKLVKVIPLFKSGDCKLTTNYCPISLLPTLSKVLEKIAYRQCLNHLDDNNLIYKHHYGFHSKHSTQRLLIKLQNVLFKAKSRKNKFWLFM